MNAEDKNISGSMKNVYTPMIASRERSVMPTALDSAPNTTPTQDRRRDHDGHAGDPAVVARPAGQAEAPR